MTTTTEQLAQLAEYYAEAAENPEAFKNWEYRWKDVGAWTPCDSHLHCYLNETTFRRKPATIEITCRGKTYTLPEPMRVEPEMGTKCWRADTCYVESLQWQDLSYDHNRLAAALLHATKEAAQQWLDAMREIRGGKS